MRLNIIELQSLGINEGACHLCCVNIRKIKMPFTHKARRRSKLGFQFPQELLPHHLKQQFVLIPLPFAL